MPAAVPPVCRRASCTGSNDPDCAGRCAELPTAMPETSTPCYSASASCGWTARRTSCSSELRGRVPGALDRGDHRVPGGGRLLVGHHAPTTSTPVSRDWQTYSSELGGITALTDAILPLELIAGDVHRDGPAQARPAQGAVPARLHAASGSPSTRTRSARSRVDVLDRLDGPRDAATSSPTSPSRSSSRVIGSFMGIPPEDDAIWARLMNSTLGAGDPDLNPEGVEAVMERDVPEIFERCRRLIAERREHPTDDLTSVLVHAEIDGAAARGARDRDGLLPARRGRQRQHEGDLLQRDARADGAPRPARSCCSTTRR